ncbi:MAG: 50S ribosomal protein L4 [Ruminococcus sp.]|nr:50S ribosomal protein L4 [Ruminococcus sp.]
MANVNIYNMNGDVVGSMELNDKIFGAEVNKSVLHSVVRAYLLNQRQGTQSTLTRTEVSGGGRKPWRQKGTGRARQGSTRSPQWTHGGVALGPKPRSYRVSINKKVKRVAMLSALSSKVQAGELIVVDNIALAEYKTKSVVAMLKALGAEKKAYIVTEEIDPVFVKSAANIPAVKTTPVNAINVYDILNSNKMVVSKQAVMKIEEVYAE